MATGQATTKYIRTSAQKAGLVLDLIRGRDVNSALATLRFARKAVEKGADGIIAAVVRSSGAPAG